MTLHTKTPSRAQLVNSNYNICPQCSAHLLAPQWSELTEVWARHKWSCETCRYKFETTVYYPTCE
jgi:hypothetical protein